MFINKFILGHENIIFLKQGVMFSHTSRLYRWFGLITTGRNNGPCLRTRTTVLYLQQCPNELWAECIFVFVRLTHGNIIFDILEQSFFQKYSACWVFLAICHMLYLCNCVFVFLHLCVWHTGISFLISLNNPLFKNIPRVGSFWHFVIRCICVFVFGYLCMRHLVISVLISLDLEL